MIVRAIVDATYTKSRFSSVSAKADASPIARQAWKREFQESLSQARRARPSDVSPELQARPPADSSTAFDHASIAGMRLLRTVQADRQWAYADFLPGG